MDFYINLFKQEEVEGTNRPHYKAVFKHEEKEYEVAFWPNKEGKKGYSGKVKPKQVYAHGVGYVEDKEGAAILSEAAKQFPDATVQVQQAAKSVVDDDEIPF